MFDTVKAYFGDDPFIFVSYSHKDRGIVLPIVYELQKNYNVWFDEGLHYGKEWDDEIADKLNHCAGILFMITDNFLDSPNCRDELEYARNNNKEFINICIDENTVFPGWFEFRFGRFQRCNFYTFESRTEAVKDLSKKCIWFETVKAKLIDDSFSTKIVTALKTMGVPCELKNIITGPAITTYEITVADSVKVSKIMKSTDQIKLELQRPELRLSLSTSKRAIIVEVPNAIQKDVPLLPLIRNDEFCSKQSKLAFVVGVDSENNVLYSDLKNLPHLFVGGRSGSGKTSFLDTVIVSIASKTSPSDVRFVLINTKSPEFNAFDALPHLLMPPVTKVQNALKVLKFLRNETERRLDLLIKAGQRDFDRYNEFVSSQNTSTEKLPYVVVLIDDIYELMLDNRDEVEMLVATTLQKSRAVGIHFVISTSMVTADLKIVTGLIKASIPSRVSFKVDTSIQSRSILDIPGAEYLIGAGDMLFLQLGSREPIRIKGAVAEENLRDITAAITEKWSSKEDASTFYNKQDETVFFEKMTDTDCEKKKKERVDAEEQERVQVAEALKILIEKKSIYTSLIQRKLSVGYNRASRLIARMQENGYISFDNQEGKYIALMSDTEYREIIRDLNK